MFSWTSTRFLPFTFYTDSLDWSVSVQASKVLLQVTSLAHLLLGAGHSSSALLSGCQLHAPRTLCRIYDGHLCRQAPQAYWRSAGLLPRIGTELTTGLR